MMFSEWIAKRKMTRAEAAKLLGVSATAITFWVHGTHRPSATMTAKIYEVTGGRVSVNDLHRAYQLARDA